MLFRSSMTGAIFESVFAFSYTPSGTILHSLSTFLPRELYVKMVRLFIPAALTSCSNGKILEIICPDMSLSLSYTHLYIVAYHSTPQQKEERTRQCWSWTCWQTHSYWLHPQHPALGVLRYNLYGRTCSYLFVQHYNIRKRYTLHNDT